MASGVALAGVAAGAGGSAEVIVIGSPSRDDLLLLDAELRERRKAASLLADGRSRPGRKTKHQTATRRWIDTVGWPAIEMGKWPSESDLRMLRCTPLEGLGAADLKARQAWDQLHARDPRSKQQTEKEKAAQQTLLSWARTNPINSLSPSAVRRGRAASWLIDFGDTWKGYSPRQLALAGAESGGGQAARSLPQRPVAPGAYLTWITGFVYMYYGGFKYHTGRMQNVSGGR
jgi:hypothetical protein